jgi:hypothetical protein
MHLGWVGFVVLFCPALSLSEPFDGDLCRRQSVLHGSTLDLLLGGCTDAAMSIQPATLWSVAVFVGHVSTGR